MRIVNDDRKTADEGYTAISVHPVRAYDECQEDAPNQERSRLDGPEGHVRGGEENLLAPNVESGAENHHQGQHHELQTPAHRPDGRSEGLFQVHQDQDEHHEMDDVQRGGYRTKLQMPDVARCSQRYYLEQSIAKTKRQSHRQKSDGYQRNSPAGQSLAGIGA